MDEDFNCECVSVEIMRPKLNSNPCQSLLNRLSNDHWQVARSLSSSPLRSDIPPRFDNTISLLFQLVSGPLAVSRGYLSRG